MSQRTDIQESFSVEARRQSVGVVGNGAASLRTTAMFPSARDLQIVDSTLSVIGGDVHNHNHYYHAELSRDIWAVLRSIPNFRKVYQDMLSKTTSGTGMWLVKGDKFRLWLEPNGDIKIFWGSGIPGAGKTLLASIVIEHLEALCEESDTPTCVCYIFFRYSERAEVTVRQILEILVKQTLERHPDVLAFVEKTYARHLRENTEPTEAQLLALLRQITDSMSATFYVLDALDEAPPKIQFAVVKALASLNAKLFITSRPLKTVEDRFPQAHAFAIIAQDVDIDLHIAKGIDESSDLQHLLHHEGPSFREEIFSTIKQNCSGMFLHASLQLDALCECISAQEVRRTLKAFPSRIEDVYLQTWDRILKQNADHVLLAKAVLVWVLNASRSMTVEELERAIATSPPPHKFEASCLVPGATLISLCRGLVAVEEESRLVRLVHYTAKGTLEGLLFESFPHPHSLLAAVCMTHLIERGFQNTTISSKEEFEAVLKEDPLLAYASDAWASHALAGMNVEDTKRQTAEFVTKCDAFPAFTSFDHTSNFDILTPLHMLGLYKLPLAPFEDMITGNPNVTTRVQRQSPLILASRSGHQAFIARLVALSEMQVNLIGTDGYSALIWAAYGGHAEVVKLLLAYPGIQVNLVHNGGWSALILGAWYGYKDVIKLLLAHPEIQANLTDNDGWSALIWAVREGRDGIVKLLLAHPGINVNLADNDRCSALMVAARVGQEGAIKLLLEYAGIQVNLVDVDGWSALMQAASEGHEGIIKLLLAYPGIQVNLVKNDGWSALMLAARYGHEGIVKLLLAHPQIQINLVSDDGWSALMLAAYGGHKGVVELLIAHPGIQVNLVRSDGWSALMLAAQECHEGIVKLLLAHPGIQVNLVKNDGWSALMLAAYGGHKGVVELLIAHPGIQVNLTNNDRWSALILAAREGHEGIIKLFLCYPGIDANLTDNEGWSALMVAARVGQDGAVKLLLTFSGIHINLVDIMGWSALSWAASEGREGAVKLLLAYPGIAVEPCISHGFATFALAAESGNPSLPLTVAAHVDVNASTKDGDAAIKLAAEGGHEAVVRMLLDVPNIDVSIRSTTDGHNAMSVALANGHSAIVELLRDFESRQAPIVGPPESPLDDNADLDSDNEEVYHDAEEGVEEHSSLSSPIAH